MTARPRRANPNLHRLAEPIVFTPGDSGARADQPFKFRAGDLKPGWAEPGDVEVVAFEK